LTEQTRNALKLPIIFFFILDIRDSCSLTDEMAVQALQALGVLGEGRRLTDGRLWVARAIAYAIARKYPAAIQFAMA
jgi:malic enzyme